MSLDDMFKHPERTNLSDSQFEKLIAQRRDEKRTRAALIAFGIMVGAVAAIIVGIVVAINI
jgi:hypothetical protein